MADNDPAKPTPNKEKFKPQNVQDPLQGGHKRGKPGDTGGMDVPQGSSGVTKETPRR
ncbi:MAG: hypothetical protein KJ703_03895 [Alphaproteobacteria bacterium]|jgi:hypothetical protein|nr:hypothetical protein [Alphaproteobacteria bacterium]